MNVTIQQFSWTREIRVDQYRTVREGDWSIPSGGRHVRDYDKIHHYERVEVGTTTETETYQCGTDRVHTGTRNNGDGTFSDTYDTVAKYCERQVEVPIFEDRPVYQRWYEYDIDRWRYSRSVNTSGITRDDPAPTWGNLTLNCAGQTQLGCERESGRPQHYYVLFVDDNQKTYQFEDSYEDWMLYDATKNYIIEVTQQNSIRNDPLRHQSEE